MTYLIENEEINADLDLNPKLKRETGRFGIINNHTLKFCVDCEKSRKAHGQIIFCKSHLSRSNTSSSYYFRVVDFIPIHYDSNVISLDKHKVWEQIDDMKQDFDTTFSSKQGCTLNVIREKPISDRFYQPKEKIEERLTKRKAKKLHWGMKIKEEEEEERKLKKPNLKNSKKRQLKRKQRRRQKQEQKQELRQKHLKSKQDVMIDEVVKFSEIRSKNPKVFKRLNKPSKVKLVKRQDLIQSNTTKDTTSTTLKTQENTFEANESVNEAVVFNLPYEKSKPSPRTFCCKDKSGSRSRHRTTSRPNLTRELATDFCVERYDRW